MEQPAIRQGSLVLYRERPALVTRVADRVEIDTEGGESLKVRPKDVALLHVGPLRRLADLKPVSGDVETAWQILAAKATTLAELADLAYGVWDPSSAWAAWEQVTHGLYFSGTPGSVRAHAPEEVERIRRARESKAAEQQAWAVFLSRVQKGEILAEDRRYCAEVEEMAVHARDRCRVLRELGRAETPENAHALLLDLHVWDTAVNPYPRRLGLTLSPAVADLPALVPEERRDLTGLAAFAIDDEECEDPDDALSLEGNRIWVHVADVAALVPPDSPADLEARSRAATLYLPELIAPMLPPAAVPILGLGLNERSPALSFGIDVGPDGAIENVEITPTWVRVRRSSYTEIDSRLQDEPFRSIRRIASVLEARRLRNGAVTIDLPEVKLLVRNGQVTIRPLPSSPSRVLVREAMLTAGEAAARFAVSHGIPFPFSTQEPPELPEERTGLAGMFALRRGMKRSQWKSTPGPHAGLGMELYSQATSPLRRYLDLVVHQQLRASLRGQPPLSERALQERLGATDALTDSLSQVERSSRRHWTLVYLQQRPGWQGDGVLVEKRRQRGIVLIPELAFDASIYLREDLPPNTVIPLTFQSADLPNLDVHFRTSVPSDGTLTRSPSGCG